MNSQWDAVLRELEAAEAEITYLRTQNEQLRLQLEAAADLQADLTHLREQLESAREANRSLSASHSNALAAIEAERRANERAEVLEATVTALREEKTRILRSALSTEDEFRRELEQVTDKWAKADATVTALRETLETLVKKLHEVHNHPDYEGRWFVSQLHSGPYKGPTYTAELKAAEAVLQGCEQESK